MKTDAPDQMARGMLSFHQALHIGLHFLLGMDTVGAADAGLLLCLRSGGEAGHGLWMLCQRHAEAQGQFFHVHHLVPSVC